jgi:hypothetical protein
MVLNDFENICIVLYNLREFVRFCEAFVWFLNTFYGIVWFSKIHLMN